MSVSVFINGVREADGKLGEMVAFKFQCDKLGMSYPDELCEYFEGTEALFMRDVESAIRAAVEVNLKHDLKIDGLVEGRVEYDSGAVVDLTKLPADIKRLRIYMK